MYLLHQIQAFSYGDRIVPVQHSKYHVSWCPGSLRRQDISAHNIEYVE